MDQEPEPANDTRYEMALLESSAMKKHLKGMIIIASSMLLLSGLAVLPFLNSSLWSDLMTYYNRFSDRESVMQVLNFFGWAAPVVFILVQLGQVVFAPIPGDVTGLLGGYLFGAWGGFFLSTLGLTIGSMLSFYIGHFLGERVVRRIVSPETYQKYNDLVQQKGILAIFILFLIPGFPKDYLCLLIGLTNLPANVFFFISTIGRLPGTLALSLQGSCLFNKNYIAFMALTGFCIVMAIIAFMTRESLYRWVARQTIKGTWA
jgi:uncharacterized membrane protein YdjX (TVP38/TMEM64 family)